VIDLQEHRFFLRFIIILYVAQVLFIALTPLALSIPRLAIIWPLLFIAVQVLLGWRAGAISKKPSLLVLLAGAAAQLPGIISSLVVLIGYSRGITTPDAFDFITQVWYAAFAPLFALLPRVYYDNVPLYFLINLLLPFIIAPLPVCGILLRRSIPGAGDTSNL
jgi:heme A synthase